MILTETSLPRIALIAAVGRNGVIGAEGDLPWRLREDLRTFKATTAGKPVVMGRRTWDSLPRRPLPARANIVISRSGERDAPGARIYSGLGVALAAGRAVAAAMGATEVMVIGGGAVYKEALPLADILYLTEVDASPAGDAFFPAIDPDDWRETESRSHAADAQNDHAFVFRRLERRTPKT